MEEKWSLDTIAYFREEMEGQEDFYHWKRAAEERKNCIFLELSCCGETEVLLQNLWGLCDWRKALLVVSSEQTLLIGTRLGAAAVGYRPKSFLKLNYVIEGFEEVDFRYLEQIYQRFHGLPWTIFETKRCIIRELSLIQETDLDGLFELYAKPGITDYLEPLYSYEEERRYQQDYIRYMYGYYGYGMWLVFEKHTGRLIGRAGLEHREYQGETMLEMGYLIAPDYQRKGFATEVCRRVIEFAWDNTVFDELNCLIDERNRASIAFIQTMGFGFRENCIVTDKKMLRYVLVRS